MDVAIMGTLDGHLDRVIFDIAEVKQVISGKDANVVFAENSAMFLEADGEVFPVKGIFSREDIKSYFMLLESGVAFNLSDYQLLFKVQDLNGHFVSGTTIAGEQCLCRRHISDQKDVAKQRTPSRDDMESRLKAGELDPNETEEILNMVKKLKEGEFFEALTTELSGKVRVIAQELIDFRKDLQSKIEPGIVEMAAKDIPEASSQLEGINETLEKSTLKILDINEEQLEMAGRQLENLKSLLSENGDQGDEAELSDLWSEGTKIAQEMKDLLTLLPADANAVAEFIRPNIDDALGLFTERNDTGKIGQVMTEPVAVINDLVRDFGNEDQGIAKLSMLSDKLTDLLETSKGNGGEETGGQGGSLRLDEASRLIPEQMEVLKRMKDLSLSMMEPLSFQDLVGQRIQKIIKLVRSMEHRIEDLIYSFGIKIQKYREHPEKTLDDLERDVEICKSELRGPQKEGEGLDQGAIDDLLADL